MDQTTFSLFLLLIAFVIVIGIIFLIYNHAKKKQTGNSSLPMILTGWILITASIVGFVALFIIFLKETSGVTGLFLFVVLSPLFIFAGVVALFSSGLSSLVSGCKKDKTGHVNKEAIVRGAVLMFLSFVLAATLVISFSIMMDMLSSSRGDKPIMGM